jgi:hypothetical protein
MKALLYKEFKLSMHYMCYLFIALFPLMILIPSYPTAIGFIYILSCYPVLFLGANKGQQSNDLLFSTLLPVRKKDIVLARIFTVLFMQLAFIALMTALLPLAIYLQNGMIADAVANGKEGPVTPGLPLQAFGSTVAFAIIGYALADLIFFPIYYKHGKSIVASTLCTILGFLTYLGIFTLGLPYAIPDGAYIKFFTNPIVQIVALVVAVLVSFSLHYANYKISAKRLERVDL